MLHAKVAAIHYCIKEVKKKKCAEGLREREETSVYVLRLRWPSKTSEQTLFAKNPSATFEQIGFIQEAFDTKIPNI